MAYKRKTRTETTEMTVSGEGLLSPLQHLTTLKWWAKLNQPEQDVVSKETDLLAHALLVTNNGALAVGEHLSKLQGVLEPHNLFQRYLSNFKFSKRTAYRFIARWKNANRLPEPIVKMASARNVLIGGDTEQKPFGVYTEAVKRLPPPNDPTPEQAATWLDQVEKVRKEVKVAPGIFASIDVDPQTALKESYRYVMTRYRQLPNNSKQRQNWARTLFGMLIAEMGFQSQASFTPQVAPEDFRRGRGRPITERAAA